MSARVCLAAAGIAAFTLGCQQPLVFQAMTSPPPLAQADLEDDQEGNTTLTLTKGVAIAVSCWNGNTGYPCVGVSLNMRDPSIASVSTGFLGATGGTPESAIVIVGLEVGDTTLDVGTSDGTGSISVTIADL